MSRGRHLVVGVTNLLRRPGSRLDVQRELPASDLRDADAELRVGDVVVQPDSAVSLDLVLEASSGDQVTVGGTVAAPYHAECRRCLEPVRGEASARVLEIFERRPTEGETYLLDGEVVDLTELVRDALVLALPLAPLCRPDCAGPAPELYPTLVGEAAGAAAGGEAGVDAGDAGDEPPGDPRWAALRDLRFD